MTNQNGYRYPNPDTNRVQTACNVYLEQGSNQSWYSLIRLNSPSEDAAMLCTEKDYPVEVSYRRTDINGSISYDTCTCRDREDLLQTLDWLGDCGFTPCQVWDFDIDKATDPALHKLFNDAYSHRLQKIQNAADDLYADAEELSYEEELSFSDSEMQEMLSRATARLEGDAKSAFQSLNEQIKLAAERSTEATHGTNLKEVNKDINRFPF